MFRKRTLKMKACTNCGESKTAKSFPKTKSPMFPDGHVSICRDCLNEAIVAEEGYWDSVDYICQWSGIPFIPENFTRIFQTNPNEAMGLYMDMFTEGEYDRVDWKFYYDKWKQLIAENKINKIHPTFNAKEVETLQEKWGSAYDTETLYKLQQFYDGIFEAYGFPDVITESNAMKLAKLDHEIDRAIAAGGAGVDKLVNAYNRIQETAGFTTENAKDSNSFESIAEIALFYEKIDWIMKYHNDTPKDIVDLTIQNIQSYNRQLYEGEPSIPDQIEASLERKARIDAREARREGDGAYTGQDEMEAIVEDRPKFAEIPDPDDADLIEEFNPEGDD